MLIVACQSRVSKIRIEFSHHCIDSPGILLLWLLASGDRDSECSGFCSDSASQAPKVLRDNTFPILVAGNNSKQLLSNWSSVV